MHAKSTTRQKRRCGIYIERQFTPLPADLVNMADIKLMTSDVKKLFLLIIRFHLSADVNSLQVIKVFIGQTADV